MYRHHDDDHYLSLVEGTKLSLHHIRLDNTNNPRQKQVARAVEQRHHRLKAEERASSSSKTDERQRRQVPRPRRPRQLYIVSLLQLFSSLRQLTEGLLLVSRIASRLSCVFQIASRPPSCKSTSRPAGRELTPGRKITSTEYNLRVVNKTGTICGIHSSSPKPSQIHTPFIYIVHDVTNSHSTIITSH